MTRFLFPIVGFLFFLAGLRYMAENEHPLLFWSYVFCAPALLAALIDVVEQRFSLARAPFLYCRYLYRSVMITLLVLLPIPILFLLGPVGLLAVILMLVDLVVGIIPDLLHDEPVRPILCAMATVDDARCVPVLSASFAAYAVCAVLAVRYGKSAYDQLIDLVFPSRSRTPDPPR